MQHTPKKRIAARDKIWLDYLRGRVKYGGEIRDTKSSTERRRIRRKIKEARLLDRLKSVPVVMAFVVLFGYYLKWIFNFLFY